MVLLSGATRVLDRVVGCVLGLLLIAAGLAALGWRQHLALTWPERVDLSPALTAMAIDWVPVVLLLVGLLLIVLGVRWLVAHARVARVRTLQLGGSDASGVLRADLRSVAAAAAADLADCAGVVDCRSKTVHDRRQTVVELTPTLRSDTDLTAFAPHPTGSVHSCECPPAATTCTCASAPGSNAAPPQPVGCDDRRGDRSDGGRSGQTSRSHGRDHQMSFADKAKHAAEEAIGNAKEKAGDATDNESLQAEGQADQTEANAKQAGDKVQNAASDAKDALS